MRPGPISKVIGILLMLFSLTMLTPVAVSIIYHENNTKPYIYSALITAVSGLFMWIFSIKSNQSLTTKDGFIVVIMLWVVLTMYGAIPYWFDPGLQISFSQAVFESVSGFTATGATVIKHLDILPNSLLYYRQQTQFFGGIGIIILSVAVLPLLGVGGMQLYRAEANGPWKENKLTPHISQTAKALWAIYAGLVFACIFAYYFAGMNFFNAILYAFSTVSTGGFAPVDTNMAGQSALVLFIAMCFMIISAIAFKLHFLTIYKRSLSHYWKDPELKSFLYIIFFASVICVLTLIENNTKGEHLNVIWEGVFQIVSFATNTGFVSASNFYMWPVYLPIMLMIIALIGGCAGSTSSGLKVVRAVLFKKQAFLEAKRLIHPRGIFVVKYGDMVVSERVLRSAWGFASAYIMILISIWLSIMAFHIDSASAFSIACAALSNVGPALGIAGSDYSDLPSGVLWICSFAMLVGRLELFTVLVLFTAEFWRR